jgi:hypothetical protein
MANTEHIEIEKIGEELEEARQDLHRTVSEVSKKVEMVNARLQPTQLLNDHLLLSVSIVGGLGFAFGNRSDASLSALLVSGLIGALASGILGYDN